MAKKVKTILISQPYPNDENSPYFKMADRWGLKIDFRKFIKIEGMSTNEFRKQNINPLDYSAIIFTSKYSIDHFFRLLADLKIELPADMKYFCVSEASAKYMQKYVTIRKRKLFVGLRTSRDLIEVVKKHKKESFLFPCSAIHTRHLTDWMEENDFSLKKAVIYNTVPSDLSDLSDVKYDMICFYSPSGVESLLKNFPEFKQNDTVVAVFGPTTAKAATDAELVVNIQAPKPNMPSMTAAIEDYLKNNK